MGVKRWNKKFFNDGFVLVMEEFFKGYGGIVSLEYLKLEKEEFLELSFGNCLVLVEVGFIAKWFVRWEFLFIIYLIVCL